RAALGIVKVILELKLPVSLSEVISAAGRGLTMHKPKLKVTPEVEKQILDFLVERAKYIFIERNGFAYDEVNAALAATSDDLVVALERIPALRAIRKSKNFEPLAVSFKRIRKILEKAGPKQDWHLPAVRPELFGEDAERKLHDSAHRVAREVEQHKRGRRYQQ